MSYYTLLIYVSLLIFDLLILNLVWRALKGPNQLTELSAAIVSFVFICIAVVVTTVALTTTVQASQEEQDKQKLIETRNAISAGPQWPGLRKRNCYTPTQCRSGRSFKNRRSIIMKRRWH